MPEALDKKILPVIVSVVWRECCQNCGTLRKEQIVGPIEQTEKEKLLMDFVGNVEQESRRLTEAEEKFRKTRALVHNLARSSGRELERAFANFVKQIWPYFKPVAFSSWPKLITLRILFRHADGNGDYFCLGKNGKFYIYEYRRATYTDVYPTSEKNNFNKQNTLEIFEQYGLKKILRLMNDAVASQVPILKDKIRELEDRKKSIENLRF